MSQNTSTAVMQRRREPHDSLDFFPTPPWATRALIKHVLPRTEAAYPMQVVWEPACGAGHMARPLSEYFHAVHSSDVHSYGFGQVTDFLWPGTKAPGPIDWVITNPPFRLAERFVHRGLDFAQHGVAVLVRTAFLEGHERWKSLFSVRPPAIIAQFVERCAIVKGRVDPRASSATAYSWLVWTRRGDGPQFVWIPKCRKELERTEDYP